MKAHGRVDDNQGEIVRTLRDVGAVVAITSALGDGFPDLVVGYRGRTVMLEVKDGRKPPSKQRLTPAEAVFHATWRGGPLFVVKSKEEALAAIGLGVHNAHQ